MRSASNSRYSSKLRSVTPRSRSASRSRSRSRSSTPCSNIALQVENEEVDKFDFDESVNLKSLTSAKVTKAEAMETDDDATKDGSKKPFMNGIDMFAEELQIGADSYNVST
jgi:hypothetical protein